MTYIPNSFLAGQVLNRAKMQQLETNVRDHQHGISSVSNIYNGIMLSTIANSSNNIIHKFSTQNNFSFTSEKLFTLSNNGIDKLSFDFKGDITSKSNARADRISTQTIVPNTWTQIWTVTSLTSAVFDKLGDVRSGGNFYAPNSGYYLCLSNINLGNLFITIPGFTAGLAFRKNGISVDNGVFKAVVSTAYIDAISRTSIVYMIPNDILTMNVIHNCTSNVGITHASMQIARIN